MKKLSLNKINLTSLDKKQMGNVKGGSDHCVSYPRLAGCIPQSIDSVGTACYGGGGGGGSYTCDPNCLPTMRYDTCACSVTCPPAGTQQCTVLDESNAGC